MCLAVESNFATPGVWQRLCATKDSQLLPFRAGLTALKKKKKRGIPGREEEGPS